MNQFVQDRTRRQSFPLRAVTVGGMIGASLTICVELFVMLAPDPEFTFSGGVLHGAWAAPAVTLYQVLLGREWPLAGTAEAQIFCTMLLTNSVLCAFVGGLVGCVVRRFRQRTRLY